jgi:hypothetical protein
MFTSYSRAKQQLPVHGFSLGIDDVTLRTGLTFDDITSKNREFGIVANLLRKF